MASCQQPKGTAVIVHFASKNIFTALSKPQTCSVLQAFLEHIDILVFVEATIYQMDEENETIAKSGTIAEGHELQGAAAAKYILRSVLYELEVVTLNKALMAMRCG